MNTNIASHVLHHSSCTVMSRKRVCISTPSDCAVHLSGVVRFTLQEWCGSPYRSGAVHLTGVVRLHVRVCSGGANKTRQHTLLRDTERHTRARNKPSIDCIINIANTR